MAHITLIRPGVTCSQRAFSVVREPSIGLAYVAAALEWAGHGVTLINALGERPDFRGPTDWPDLDVFGLPKDEILALCREWSGAASGSASSSQWAPDRRFWTVRCWRRCGASACAISAMPRVGYALSTASRRRCIWIA